MPPSPGQITLVLSELSPGNPEAALKLFPLVRDELRNVAAKHLRHERPGHTLQATELANHAWFRLLKSRRLPRFKDRVHLYCVVSQVMRRVLIDHARKRNSQKRDHGQRVELEKAYDIRAPERPRLIEALDDALVLLEKRDPRMARIIEMRYFGGYSVEETAEALDLGRTTVNAESQVAIAFLRRELDPTL